LQSLGAGLRLALVGSLTLLLVACGGSGKRPVSADSAEANEKPEDVVKMRAIKRWELLIDKRFEEAYDLLSPGYREVRSKEDYVKIMRARPLQWTRVHFQDATCAEESCAVNIEVSAQFEMPVMRVGTVDTLTVVTENWVSSDGEWYLVPAADR
jgi:hypothetical protein